MHRYPNSPLPDPVRPFSNTLMAEIVQALAERQDATLENKAGAILPIIEREVTAETERCAQVAQSKAEFGPAALAIANAIRSAG